MAGENRPAGGFDGQVSVPQQPIKWRRRLSAARRSAAFGASPVVDDPQRHFWLRDSTPQSRRSKSLSRRTGLPTKAPQDSQPQHELPQQHHQVRSAAPSRGLELDLDLPGGVLLQPLVR
jgi:hypothetical protein